MVRAAQCETHALPSTDDRCEADIDNPVSKSHRKKSLDMRDRLELWLAEKGKTPKYKTPAVLKHSSSVVQRQDLLEEKMRLSFGCDGETDGALTESVIISPGEGENMEEKLQECLLQLEKSECDPEKVAAKLDLYNSSCPHTSQIANYWLCRAKIAQQEKDFDRVVCLLEQAFVFKAQPESVLKDAVCTFVNFMKESGQQDAVTDEICQLPVSPPNETKIDLNDSLDELNSSVIKFCLTEATPYRKKFKATFGKPVLTPVRRSVRLERASAQHPSVLQEHDLTVRRLGELPEDIQQDVLFKPNFAVRAELNEAWNELQLDYNQ
ncbi:Cytoskeleton-associated protein 2 C-terminus [Desmophyllum pertusum]|uniref:Cytoskeleton-associated protein 2 C-terminus n=1 Tax=Desmophyllum pertusum TaxID=174260 RepID=A0A9W9Z8E4_9CNID|nr:Cytoskeleton-associated protein 2 C-terminus [Desmophyllum pertusum]